MTYKFNDKASFDMFVTWINTRKFTNWNSDSIRWTFTTLENLAVIKLIAERYGAVEANVQPVEITLSLEELIRYSEALLIDRTYASSFPTLIHVAISVLEEQSKETDAALLTKLRTLL